MYQGKNPTALTSQKMLVAALSELLKEKDFKDLSVSELCSRSGVSRQTFYSLFGTKENILLYQLEQSSSEQYQSVQEMSEMTLMDTCTIYSRFVVSNYELLKMLVNNDLTAILNNQFVQAMSSCEQSFVNVSSEEKEYASQFMSAGLCSLTCRYIESHNEPDQEELAKLAYKIMSGNIYRYS